ncbi:MAG: 30S ribosomal protein S1 [Campylobacterota bacterium]
MNKEFQDIEMTDEDFAAMLDESLKGSQDQILDGVIAKIEDTQVLVDINQKLEAIMNIDEIKDEEGELTYKEGDKIDVVKTRQAGSRTFVSHKKAISKVRTKEFIAEYDDQNEYLIEGKIVGKNKGGYVVEADGIEFFMPNSLAAFRKTAKVVGRDVKAYVVKVDKEKNSIVISRKAYLDRKDEEREDVIKEVMEKDVINGVVKTITSYGMFVDVGGVDGLVHYSEISHRGPVNAAKHFEVGNEVEVKAIAYDPDKKHLSLSIKATIPNPWEEVKEEIDEGDTIKVTVSNIESYGAFVDLGNDIEGFLHVSEISWDRGRKDPKDYISIGDELDVEVIEIDSDKQRLRVSLKTLKPKPFDQFASSHKPGDVVEGEVNNTTDFGAFIKLGEGVEGLLHNDNVDWNATKANEAYKAGDKVEVKIISIDKDSEKISLSTKALLPSPAAEFEKEHNVGDIVTGTLKDITDFGVFVKLNDKVDGLIRNEELGPIDTQELEKGQEIEAVIIMIDPKKDRVRLSVKKKDKQQEQEILRNMDDSTSTLGDVLKDHLK